MKKQIKPEQYQKLIQANDKLMGLDKFIKGVIAEGQRSNSEIGAEVRALWQEIAKDIDIDLRNQEWVPSQEEANTIVLTAQRFP